jgi:VIT1/CCC1 family predicted Fe2+/Mn2+ transporter
VIVIGDQRELREAARASPRWCRVLAWLCAWKNATERELVLQVVQPGLVGLIDGTVSTLAPIFTAAYLGGSHTALIVGLATALGAGISMALSEGLSDTGEQTGRGSPLARALIIGFMTFVGGSLHSLPFLIRDVDTALAVAYAVVAVELWVIAWIRKRFLHVPLGRSIIQVVLGGAAVVAVGFTLGHA